MTATKIKQSEFAETHNLKAPEVAKLRRDHLREGVDFWSEGRTIFWTEEAAEKISSILSTADTKGNVSGESETFSARITKPARNARWVYGVLDGNQIAIACGKHAKRILGKTVTIKASETDGITIYTYEP